MPFDDDVREPPELASRCFTCDRAVAFDLDRCIYCGSVLMVNEQTVASILARRTGRPLAKKSKARRR